MSGSSSALMERKEIVGGDCTGYEEARAERTVDICAHGAAQGVWKYRTRSAVAGRWEMCWWKSASAVISVTVDMVVYRL